MRLIEPQNFNGADLSKVALYSCLAQTRSEADDWAATLRAENVGVAVRVYERTVKVANQSLRVYPVVMQPIDRVAWTVRQLEAMTVNDTRWWGSWEITISTSQGRGSWRYAFRLQGVTLYRNRDELADWVARLASGVSYTEAKALQAKGVA